MRHPLTYLLCLLALGIMFFGCSDQPVATSDPQSSENAGLEKAELVKYSYELDMAGLAFGCPTGEPMTVTGKIMVYIEERWLPFGRITLSGYADYFFFPDDPVTMVGATSGTWTLVKAENHFGEIYRDYNYYPNFFIQHFEWQEFYENDDGGKMTNFGVGMMKISSDGTIEVDRFSAGCR